MNTSNEVIQICNDMIAAGADLESVLHVLRHAGYSKVQSMKALVDLDQATLAEAKTIVHNSAVWRDAREQDEAFQDLIADALDCPDEP